MEPIPVGEYTIHPVDGPGAPLSTVTMTLFRMNTVVPHGKVLPVRR